jgi:RNA polymerase-binding transcription factor DksA
MNDKQRINNLAQVIYDFAEVLTEFMDDFSLDESTHTHKNELHKIKIRSQSIIDLPTCKVCKHCGEPINQARDGNGKYWRHSNGYTQCQLQASPKE